ncbi:MAG: acyl carrier protein [Ilumatobacteraceae bacterium]
MSERALLIRKVLQGHGHLVSDPTTIAEDASLYNAGLTSHASVNVMLALEDEFDLEFPERFLKRSTFESIRSLCAAVDSLLGAEHDASA